MAYDVSTTGRGFVKSLHELGQSSAINEDRLHLWIPGTQNQTDQFSETQRQGWPCRKTNKLCPSHSLPTEWLISAEKVMCVYKIQLRITNLLKIGIQIQSVFVLISPIWSCTWRNTGLLKKQPYIDKSCLLKGHRLNWLGRRYAFFTVNKLFRLKKKNTLKIKNDEGLIEPCSRGSI